jgi:DMSO/TMAO reductase YedYZ molybdopterin-dependent catalytic subunit
MTMQKLLINRRKFMTAATLGATGLVTAGCDVFDPLGNRDNPLRNVMEGANGLTYRVQRLLAGRDSLAQEFSEADIRQPQRPNGVTAPDDDFYKGLLGKDFANWRLEISGLVEKPLSLSREQLVGMPARTQITRHDCVEGWSCIAKWTGVPLALVLDQAVVKPEARFAVFHCLDSIERGLSGDVKYYSSIDLIDARHPQTILAYGLNGKPLPVENGAPLRVRVERQLGYKMPKYIHKIELVDSFAAMGLGKGGYWEDRGYDWFGGI